MVPEGLKIPKSRSQAAGCNSATARMDGYTTLLKASGADAFTIMRIAGHRGVTVS
jgi:hypothetical protein